MVLSDISLRHGDVLLPSGELTRCDVGIVGSQIAQIGPEVSGRLELDATGCLVLPGAIDPHVHLSYPASPEDEKGWADDFTSGSRAALAGGITTVGNMSFPLPGELPLETLEREEALVRAQSMVDVVLHPVLGQTGAHVEAQLPTLRQRGVSTLKLFTLHPYVEETPLELGRLLSKAGELGILPWVHCEDRPLLEAATREIAARDVRDFSRYPDCRPVLSEVEAIRKMGELAKAHHFPLYVVHLSSEGALNACRDLRREGVELYMELRPLYLFLTRERYLEAEGAKYVCQPPLREGRDVEAMWRALSSETGITLGSDHAPWRLADKLDREHTLLALRPGVSELQTMMPMLYSEGVRRGRITLSQLVRFTSENPAKALGLYPKKGALKVGSDGDVVLFNPKKTQTIRASMLVGGADFSAYEGWEVTGWPEVVLRRGRIAYQHGQVLEAPGSGEPLKSQPFLSFSS